MINNKRFRPHWAPAIAIAACFVVSGTAQGQSFGIELFNNLMPASGAMAGASIASPQDVQSSINGNPATLRQFRGTHFSFGTVWVEPTYNLTQPIDLPLFGVSAFPETKSDAQGIAAGNIGVTQDYSSMGLPVTVGMGLVAGGGGGVDFRQQPNSNGSHASLVALDVINSVGVDLTDRLAVGATLALSAVTLDGPFVGITSSSTDYALYGKLAFNYELLPDTNVGAYWRTKAGFTFDNLVQFPITGSQYFNVSADRPEVFGIGIANSSLMDGKLLIAVDGRFQRYSDADLFGALFEDQWAVQVGAQYSPTCRCRLRLGYAWNENPMREIVPASAGGVLPPGGVAHIKYMQAMFAAIPQHRITGGFGVRDVMPGVDVDLFAGGMFEATQTFSFSQTTASVESYWVGLGLTWRFCRGS